MNRTWTYTVTENTVIFLQKTGKGKIRRMKLSRAEVENALNGASLDNECGGCRDLPLRGYASGKYSWCQLSRAVANMYENGHRWTTINK